MLKCLNLPTKSLPLLCVCLVTDFVDLFRHASTSTYSVSTNVRLKLMEPSARELFIFLDSDRDRRAGELS